MAGHPADVPELGIIAYILGGNIGLGRRWTFETVQTLVDVCVTVTEDEIKQALRPLFHLRAMMVVGAGAVIVTALMSGKVKTSGPAACVLCGCTIAPDDFLDLMQQSGGAR